MTSDQVLPAFIAALLRASVSPDTINQAVARVLDLKLGQSISDDDPLIAAFAREQTRRLETHA